MNCSKLHDIFKITFKLLKIATRNQTFENNT